MKIKVGSEPDVDPARVGAAREAIGENVELLVDANGAYYVKQALELAERFRAEAAIAWFEEPVSSDDLDGLQLVRDGGPAGVAVAAGEYGYDLPYFRRMLPVVDVLQADVRAAPVSPNWFGSTRCAGGATGRCRCTARRRSTCTRRSRSGSSRISSTSTTTSGSSSCCSTAFPPSMTGPWPPT